MGRYNYEHFWAGHLVADLVRSARGAGLRAGEPAPDFTLLSIEGDSVALRSWRDRPVLLHFGSGT